VEISSGEAFTKSPTNGPEQGKRRGAHGRENRRTFKNKILQRVWLAQRSYLGGRTETKEKGGPVAKRQNCSGFVRSILTEKGNSLPYKAFVPRRTKSGKESIPLPGGGSKEYPQLVEEGNDENPRNEGPYCCGEEGS